MLPVNIEIPDQWASLMALDVINAKHEVLMTALSMLPPRATQAGPWPALWRELLAAAARGVKVEICLAAPSRHHPATAQNVASASFAHSHGLHVKLISGPRLLHAKQAIIDTYVVWVGSGNFTAAAAAHNHETYIRVASENLARRLRVRIQGYEEANG